MDREPENLFWFIAGGKISEREGLTRQPGLAYCKVPEEGFKSIRSKLAFKILDEYANILKGMYSTRFNGQRKNDGDHDQMDATPNNIGNQKEKYHHTLLHTFHHISRRRRP
jgi:hypothetical protein